MVVGRRGRGRVPGGGFVAAAAADGAGAGLAGGAAADLLVGGELADGVGGTAAGRVSVRLGFSLLDEWEEILLVWLLYRAAAVWVAGGTLGLDCWREALPAAAAALGPDGGLEGAGDVFGLRSGVGGGEDEGGYEEGRERVHRQPWSKHGVGRRVGMRGLTVRAQSLVLVANVTVPAQSVAQMQVFALSPPVASFVQAVQQSSVESSD